MLTIQFKSHRGHLKAGTDEPQKLFALLKLIPDEEVARTRPPLALALVVDTSGSMREFADQAKAREEIERKDLPTENQEVDRGNYQAAHLSLPTKLDQAIQAAHALVDDDRLGPDDRITIIHFDDHATTLLPLVGMTDRQPAHDAIESMRKHSGGTHMARGMRNAGVEFQALSPQVAKRVVLLTDGKTFDEPDCRRLSHEFAESNTPLIAIGIGAEYNEDLMRELADATQGRPYHLQNMEQLRDILNVEVGVTVREVVTDLQASVATVRGVTLDSVTRVYPSLADVSLQTSPYRLGNIAAGDYTVFTLEFTVSGVSRPPSRARLAQIGLSGHAPALGRRDEFSLQNLFVTFTPDESAIASVDPEVLGYVQQKNVDRMVNEAVRQATVDAGKARQTLQVARGMTQRLGNDSMTRMLDNALDELNQSGSISSETRKTVALGGRTRTVKTGEIGPGEGIPTEEEIRRLTGA